MPCRDTSRWVAEVPDVLCRTLVVHERHGSISAERVRSVAPNAVVDQAPDSALAGHLVEIELLAVQWWNRG